MFRTPLALGLIVGAAVVMNPADGLGKGNGMPAHATLHTNPVTNDTGQTANDLHVNVPGINPFSNTNPTAPPLQFKDVTSIAGGSRLNFDSGGVPNGSNVEVTWSSLGASDAISGGQWTKDGTSIGAFAAGIIQAEVMPDPTAANKGLIFIDNTSGKPVQYTNLAVFTDVPQFGFTPDLYLNLPFQFGPPVTTDLASRGTLEPGLTLLGEIDANGDIGPTIVLPKLGSAGPQSLAADPPPFYDVGSLDINGQVYGLGVSSEVLAPLVVPEPASLTILTTGVLALAGAALRGHLRRRRAAGAAGA